MALGDLFEGSAPPAVSTATVSQQNLPAWYQEYARGLTAKGLNFANTDYQPYGNDRIADFNADQRVGFSDTRNNQGAWQPGVTGAMQAGQGIVGAAQPGLQAAGAAVTGLQGNANQAWPANSAAYMNPYQSQVVNEIARLGNQNFTENLMPQIDSSFVGAGQFGSTRNADIMGRALRDTQQNITGQQSQALQGGWNTSANIFNQDQSRGNQALSSAGGIGNQMAQTAAAAQDSQAGRLGALGSLQSQLGYTDAGQLNAIGGQQQGQTQRNMDMAYNDFQNQRDWDKNQLGFASNLTRGMQMPTSTAQVSNGPASYYAPSTAQAATGALAMYNAGQTKPA